MVQSLSELLANGVKTTVQSMPVFILSCIGGVCLPIALGLEASSQEPNQNAIIGLALGTTACGATILAKLIPQKPSTAFSVHANYGAFQNYNPNISPA